MTTTVKLKVCGMRDPDNIRELIEVGPDLMGMIFYEKSPRYVSGHVGFKTSQIDHVGVFVNPTKEEVLDKVKEYGLKYIQLHGSESVEFVSSIKQAGLIVIKVFRIIDELPVLEMKAFNGLVDYFLFDTKTALFGGSGQQFNWEILEAYPFETPYFLSGGIDLEDVPKILKMDLPKLYAIDVNSRFEVKPGLKDIQKIKKLKAML